MKTVMVAMALATLFGTVNAFSALPVEGADLNRQHIVVPKPQKEPVDGEDEDQKWLNKQKVDAVKNDQEAWPEEETPFIIPQVAISIFSVKISPTLAADWGLDGGLAAKPETSPFKGDVPRVMTKQQARMLITALRKHKETTIIGSTSLVVQSGMESFGLNAKEIMFPESFDETSGDVEFPEDDEDAASQAPVSKRPPRRKPNRDTGKFDLNGLIPLLGEPRTDVGVSLVVTPMVGEPSRAISLDLHPKLVVDKAINCLMPMFSTLELQMEVTMKSGQTMILMTGTPAKNGDYNTYKPDAATDRRPCVVFLSAEIVDLQPAPKSVKKKTPVAKPENKKQ